MAQIPIGRFGFQTAEPAPTPRAPAGAFGNAEGFAAVAGNLKEVAKDAYQQEAIADATTATISAKRQMDSFLAELDANPVGSDGKPRRDGGLQDFEKFSQKLMQEAAGSTRNADAQRVIKQSLMTYGESQRSRLVQKAQKMRADQMQAGMLLEIEATRADASIRPEEKLNRIGQVLGAMVATGSMDPSDAVKERQRQEGLLEYGRIYEDIMGANSVPRLYELRGQLSKFNPKMSEANNRQLVEMVSARIKQLDEEQDRAVRQQREDIKKDLTNAYFDGTLTIDQVRQYENKLPADDFEAFMKLPDLSRRRDVEGGDDPELFRSLQRDVLQSYRNGAELNRLRGRVTNLMTGYDPATKTYGTPALSRDTARRLVDDIEGYLRELRTEGRMAVTDTRIETNDKRAQRERDRGEVEQLMKGAFKGARDAAIGRDAQSRVAEREQQALDALLKNRDDPMAFWEKFKKDNPDILKPRRPLPSWAIQSAGKLDATATKRQLLEQKQKGTITESQYQQRFNQIIKLEGEQNAGQ